MGLEDFMKHFGKTDEYMQKEKDYKVVENMEKYGGSFIVALAGAFRRADYENFAKLKEAFPEYWEEYKNFETQK